MSDVGIKRRKLNEQQIAVLEWLLKYRFSTSKQIATHLGKASHKTIQSKLQILEAQDLIGKRYDKSYKLAGRQAEYYLTPKGARHLEAIKPETVHPKALKALYKNKTISQDFLKHCVIVTDVALQLQALYGVNGKKCTIHTANSLHKHEYLPDWLPDFFLVFSTSSSTKRAFIDVWDGSRPFFVSVRKLRNYIAYLEEGDWPYDQAAAPAILAVCADTYSQKKLNRQIKKALQEADDADSTHCATTTLEQLSEAEKPTERIWLRVCWGDDPQPATLGSIYS